MAGRALILVRHAMPEVERGIASKLWELSEASKEDCVLLAHALPDELAPTVYSSDEPKAQQTAAVIALRRGLATAVDPGFGEVDRSVSGWLDDHRAAALRYLETGEAPGWEPRTQVVRRFSDAVVRAMDQPGEGDVVVATHGQAMSLFLDSRSRIEIGRFWEALTLPDAWRFWMETGELARVFAGGKAAD